jgi:hypothetical protein
MLIQDIKKLSDDLVDFEKDINNFSVNIVVKDGQKISDLLQKIKKMGYAAFLRAGAFGIEVVVTDSLN